MNFLQEISAVKIPNSKLRRQFRYIDTDLDSENKENYVVYNGLTTHAPHCAIFDGNPQLYTDTPEKIDLKSQMIPQEQFIDVEKESIIF